MIRLTEIFSRGNPIAQELSELSMRVLRQGWDSVDERYTVDDIASMSNYAYRRGMSSAFLDKLEGVMPIQEEIVED